MGICVSCRRRERKAPEKRWVSSAGGPAKGAAAELLPRQVHLQAMANSISNIKMTNPIKGMVSKRRKRYVKDGFNLDLAYITDRIIAMGFPAEKLEGVYRNHIDEVYRFLEQMHKGHYMIYNLCAERKYDANKFHDRVKKFAFKDHEPPRIEQIQPFCESVHTWLSEDSRNVAAVHCKAGKGRTGTMICCYLLYSGQKATADEALKFYGTKRAHDEKGVTIPSQRRYVEYYAALVRGGLAYRATRVHVREVRMSPPPALNGGQCTLELVVSQAEPQFKASLGSHELRRHEAAARVAPAACTPLQGDVRVDVYCRQKMMMRKEERLFHFCFNTFFVTACVGAAPVPAPSDSPNLETFKLTLDKWQLDDAHKDKQHKLYSPDFKVEVIIQKQPESSTFSTQSLRAPSTPSSASTCSENDEHWDSGEGFLCTEPADAHPPLYTLASDVTPPLYLSADESVTPPLHTEALGVTPSLHTEVLGVTPPLYTFVPTRDALTVTDSVIPLLCPKYQSDRTISEALPLYSISKQDLSSVSPPLSYRSDCIKSSYSDRSVFEAPLLYAPCKSKQYSVTTLANESILTGVAPALSNSGVRDKSIYPYNYSHHKISQANIPDISENFESKTSYNFNKNPTESPLYFVPLSNVLCNKLHTLCNVECPGKEQECANMYKKNYKCPISTKNLDENTKDSELPYVNILCGRDAHKQYMRKNLNSDINSEISNNLTINISHTARCEGLCKNKRSSDSDMYEILHTKELCHKKPNCQNVGLSKPPIDNSIIDPYHETETSMDNKVCPNGNKHSTDNNLYSENQNYPIDPDFHVDNDIYLSIDNNFPEKANADFPETKPENPTECDPSKSKNDKKDKKCKDMSKARLLGDMRASWKEFSGKFGENRKKKQKDD